MTQPTLLEQLQSLETELHHAGTRASAHRLQALLHPEFFEVGRSGRRYDRDTCIRFLQGDSVPVDTQSADFALTPLSDDIALLTYRSVQRGASGERFNPALRASIWKRTTAGWQLVYHQGTPAFEVEHNPPHE